MMGEIQALLDRHLPGYEIRSAARLGEGLDNAAYEVNGELILRRRKETDPAQRRESTRREAELLTAVAGLSTLPVPEPVFADAESGVIAYFRLPGLPLMGRPVAEPARLASTLGGFLDRLHRAPVGALEGLVGRDEYPLPAWCRDAERDYEGISAHLPEAARRLIEDFLGRATPAEPRAAVLCHNDLGTEHVLVAVETGAATGVIDWADAAVTDPARDFARLYRDLGPDFCDSMLDYYQPGFDGTDLERAVFYARCSAIEDIAFGIATGTHLYADNALANLARTFDRDASPASEGWA